MFGTAGAETGYNRQKIEELRDVINTTAQKAGEGIVEILYDGIITSLKDSWYAPEAVEFSEGFAETVKQAGQGVTEAFDAFRDAIQKAGANWAENTKGEAPTLSCLKA